METVTVGDELLRLGSLHQLGETGLGFLEQKGQLLRTRHSPQERVAVGGWGEAAKAGDVRRQ